MRDGDAFQRYIQPSTICKTLCLKCLTGFCVCLCFSSSSLDNHNMVCKKYAKNTQNSLGNTCARVSHSVHRPLSTGGSGRWGGGGVEPPTKFSKRGGLAGPQLLEGGCWERGGYFFQGGGLQLSYKKLILCLIMNFMFN